ncbi:MAG: phospholipase D-like domain-containing protein [Clostridium sp.]
MNIYILISLMLTSLAYFIVPIELFFVLSVCNFIYYYYENSELVENLKFHSYEYIITLVLEAIIIFSKSNMTYLFLPIEAYLISRIIVYHIRTYKNDYELAKNLNPEISIDTVEQSISKHQLSNLLSEELNNLGNNLMKTIENKTMQIDSNVKTALKEAFDKNTITESVQNEVLNSIKSGEVKVYNEYQLMNSEIKRKFIETFSIAEKEIDIISPWVSNWIFNEKEIMNGFKKALSRGVNIKIIYGIGNEPNKEDCKRNFYTDENVNKLSKMFSSYKGKLIFKKGNTHEKILICDDAYYLIGSYNLLSFKGDYTGNDIRNEIMTYSENKVIINNLRRTHFSCL